MVRRLGRGVLERLSWEKLEEGRAGYELTHELVWPTAWLWRDGCPRWPKTRCMLAAAVSAACGVGLEAELYAIEHFNPVLCRQVLALTMVALPHSRGEGCVVQRRTP